MRQEIAPGVWFGYEDAGTGVPVVLLHGYPFSRAMWAPQRELADRVRLITPDFRGFGESTGFTGTPSLDQHADDVAALLDHLVPREKVVLGGLSMGGYVALAFASRYPDRLRGLILADTRAETDSDTARTGRNQAIAELQAGAKPEVVESLLPKLIGETTRRDQPWLLEQVRSLMLAQSEAAMIGALQAMRDRPDSVASLSSIRVPTLVLVGEEDHVTPLAAAQTLAKGIPQAQLRVLPATGHMSNWEQPGLFNATVSEFVNSLAR